MSASVVPPSRFELARISAKLRKLAPALAQYRRLLVAQIVLTVDTESMDEMREFTRELMAYDRWRSFEHGREESCLRIVTGSPR